MVAVIAVALLAGSGAAVVVLLSAGSPSENPRASASPRPVSADEANRLAVMRFQNYRGTGLHFNTEIVAGKATLRLDGDVDFRKELGYAKIAGAGSSFTLQWDARTLVAWPGSSAGPSPPAKLPTGTPARRALAPSGPPSTRSSPWSWDCPRSARQRAAHTAQRGEVVGTRPDRLHRGRRPAGARRKGSAIRLRRRPALLAGHDRARASVEAFLGGGSRRTQIDLDATSFTAFARSAQLPA